MSKKQKTGSNQELVDKNNAKLKSYADEINKLHTEIESNQTLSIKHGKIVLQLAIKAGQILNQARKLVPHKEWESWVKENVKGVSFRTCQNYKRLATALAIEQEHLEAKKKFGGMTEETAAQHVSFLADAEGLREAYITAGIIKKPKMISAAVDNGDPKQEAERLKKLKEENEVEYKQIVEKACIKMKKKVRADIDEDPKLSWRLCDWMINGDKVRPTDKSNNAANLFSSLSDWIVKREREYEKVMTAKDEIKRKTLAVIAEVIKSFITSNQPADFVMEITPKTTPVEVKEMVAA